MRKKLLILSLMIASSVVLLPFEVTSATTADTLAAAKTSPQIHFQIGNRRHRHWNRGRHYGWYRGRHRGWYKHRRAGWYNPYYRPWTSNRTAMQVYWVNGRRYTRYVTY